MPASIREVIGSLLLVHRPHHRHPVTSMNTIDSRLVGTEFYTLRFALGICPPANGILARRQHGGFVIAEFLILSAEQLCQSLIEGLMVDAVRHSRQL